jgi:hypothetical protein
MRTAATHDGRADRRERGTVLTGVLVLTFALMAIAALTALSGYTNLLTAANLTAAAGAKASAENAINEAIYRLSLPDTEPAAIVPDLTDPEWRVGVFYTTGDADPSDQTLSTLQAAADWPPDHDPAVPAATLRFKRDDAGDVVFYNRAAAPGTPPFMRVGLPSPVGPVVGTVYELLCAMPSILGLQVGGVLGLCPPGVTATGYPVIQITATGLDVRGARRQLVAEAARSIAFTPYAPLNAGGPVDLNGRGFIDGVNHDARIHLTGGGGSAAVFGDESGETTDNMAVLGLLPIGVRDGPDDHNLWTNLLDPLLVGPLWHGVANASLVLYFDLTPAYTSFPRLFNLQVAAADSTPAWVGVTQLTEALTSSLTLPTGQVVPPANLGVWSGMNLGYSAPIALSASATVTNPPLPPTTSNSVVWNSGVFSWRINNRVPANGAFPGSVDLTSAVPAPGSVLECGPPAVGEPPPLVCRPARMATIPPLERYLGINEVAFASLLADPTTARTELDLGQPPLGVTFVDGSYTLPSTTASPASDRYGLFYVRGNLTVTGTHVFKGMLWVDGTVTIADAAHLTVLGTVVARDGYTHAGTGRTTLLYSREAALRGVAHARPWRILSWADVAALQ